MPPHQPHKDRTDQQAGIMVKYSRGQDIKFRPGRRHRAPGAYCIRYMNLVVDRILKVQLVYPFARVIVIRFVRFSSQHPARHPYGVSAGGSRKLLTYSLLQLMTIYVLVANPSHLLPVSPPQSYLPLHQATCMVELLYLHQSRDLLCKFGSPVQVDLRRWPLASQRRYSFCWR